MSAWLRRSFSLCLRIGAGAAVVAGCAVGPDFERPAPPSATRFTSRPDPATTFAADGQDQRIDPEAELPADWWRLFGSAALDATVRAALAHSPTLQSAEAALRQSYDNLRAGAGVFYPGLAAGADFEHARSAPMRQGSAAPGSIYSVATLSGSITYPLDVFGGERRLVEGLRARVDVQDFEAKAARLTLAANVVNAVIARAAYAAERRAIAELIELEIGQLRSADAQSRAGTVPYANVLVQRSLIASNRAVIASLDQKVAQADHLLAMLGGQLTAEASLPDIAFASLTLPADLPVSLPSRLVRQRPDILAAEAQLHAASADIGVATAALFPSFALDATYGRAGTNMGALFAGAGPFWSFGPSIVAPLFRGGTLHAQRQAAIDAYAVREGTYRQTVLVAFEQVADALAALDNDARAVEAQSQARQYAGRALELQQASFRAGMVAYVDLLAAEIQVRQAVVGYVQALAQRQQDTVLLFVALGGGWWNAPSTNAGAAP